MVSVTTRRVLIVDQYTALHEELVECAGVAGLPMSFLHASSYPDALESVRRNDVDAIVVELRPDTDSGLELLWWMTNHRPQVVAFAMSPTNRAADKVVLDELFIECFQTPLDCDAMLRVLAQRVKSSVRGQFRNITLPSILQILEAERATCLLRVTSPMGEGCLGVVRGELRHATANEVIGDEAAIEIFGWSDVRVDALSRRSRHQDVNESITYLVMEAMRRLDDAGVAVDDQSDVFLAMPPLSPTSERAPEGSVEGPPDMLSRSPDSSLTPSETVARLHAVEERRKSMPTEQELVDVLKSIEGSAGGFVAASLVDLGSGMPLATHSVRSDFDLAAASAYNSELVKQKLQIMKTLGISGTIQDMLITLDEQIHLIKMISNQTFLYLAVMKAQSNLAIVRMAVERHADRLSS